MLDLAAGRSDGYLFTDDVRRPVAVTDLAAALVELTTNDFAGILNLGGTDAISFYDLGVLIARRHGLDPSVLVATTIKASGHSRPGNVQLDSSLAASVLATRLRGVRELFAEGHV